METLLVNCKIYDGLKTTPYFSDILIKDKKIFKISTSISKTNTKNIIDVNGSPVSPGFIDVHAHDDLAVMSNNQILPKISQGITTTVCGNCGISAFPLNFEKHSFVIPPFDILSKNKNDFFNSTTEYVNKLTNLNLPINILPLIGHSALRIKHLNDISKPANNNEIYKMQTELDEALSLGIKGFSVGLAYATNFAADDNEIYSLLDVVKKHEKLVTAHIRNEYKDVFVAAKEMIEMAKSRKIKLHLSHQKMAGKCNHGRVKELINLIEDASKIIKISFDTYPYNAGSTIINKNSIQNSEKVLLTWSEPYPEFAGNFLEEIAKEMNLNLLEAAEKLQPGGAIYFHMKQEDVNEFLVNDLCVFGSDGLPIDTHPHPRLFGSFPKIFNDLVKNETKLTPEAFFHKASYLPSQIFNIKNRGAINEDFFADLIIFEPNFSQFKDNATYENPKELSTGINCVLVNGDIAYQNKNIVRNSGMALL